MWIRKVFSCVAVSYAALAYAVLYAILNSSTKYLYLSQKSRGKCRKNKCECLILYQKHNVGPVCGTVFRSLKWTAFKIGFIKKLG